MREKVEKVTLSNPLRRVHSVTIAQFSLFPSGPPKYKQVWPKALQMEAQCSQKPLRRGSQKSDKTIKCFLSLLRVSRDPKWVPKKWLLGRFWGSGTSGAPGRSQGSPQAPSQVQILAKKVPEWMPNASFFPRATVKGSCLVRLQPGPRRQGRHHPRRNRGGSAEKPRKIRGIE